MHPRFKIGFTPHLGRWKGTKMLPIDRYLKAEMSEEAIGTHLNICSTLRSTVCEGLGPYIRVVVRLSVVITIASEF